MLDEEGKIALKAQRSRIAATVFLPYNIHSPTYGTTEGSTEWLMDYGEGINYLTTPLGSNA